MTSEYIHAAGLRLCKEANSIEFKRVLVLQALDKDKIYQRYDKPSLFKYVVDFWNMPEDLTYILLGVARKAVAFPKLQLALKEQTLTVPKAHRFISVISDEMIEFAKTHTYKEIDREVARRNPKPTPRTKIKPIGEDRFSLEMEISEAFRVKLERCKSVRAQKTSSSPTPQEALEVCMDSYLYHEDPVEKAKRSKKEETFCAHRKGRQPFTAAQRAAVNKRDKGKCTHRHNGQRCNSDRWVDLHHIKNVKDGGTNHSENLTTLCWFHHNQEHKH